MKDTIVAVALLAVSVFGGEAPLLDAGSMEIRDLALGGCFMTFTFGEQKYIYMVQPCDFIKRKNEMFKDGVVVLRRQEGTMPLIYVVDRAKNKLGLEINKAKDITGKIIYNEKNALWLFVSNTDLKDLPVATVDKSSGIETPTVRKADPVVEKPQEKTSSVEVRDLPRGWLSVAISVGEQRYIFMVQPCDFIAKKKGFFEGATAVTKELSSGKTAIRVSAGGGDSYFIFDKSKNVSGKMLYYAKHDAWVFVSTTDLEEAEKLAAEATQASRERVAAREKAAETPAEKDATDQQLQAHWQTVRVQVKPEAPTLSFRFDCSKDRVNWTVTASNGSVDYRAYDVRFFNGNIIIRESITILEKLKRGQGVADSTFVDPMEVTRIEVRLRQ